MPSDRILYTPLLIALLLIGSSCAEQQPARNVILISIDTLRADRLGMYRDDAQPFINPSPSLDALAADGVLFDDVTSAAPWTLPSHASLITGLYPNRHGLRTVELRMASTVPTLASVLGDRGFETAAIANVLFLGRGSGFPRGFAEFEIVPSKPSRAGAAKEIVAKAKAWLGQDRDRPTFLFVHFFDPHSDYQSLPEFEAMFTSAKPGGANPRRFDGSTSQIIQATAGRTAPVKEHEADHLQRLYDAGIRQLDEELGGFFAWLREQGHLEDTLVVVTSDHGEEFLDHGGMLHSATHYQEVIRVPLFMLGAGLPKGKRVSTPVSIVDVLPTVLSVLDAEPVQDIDGRDLQPLWRAPTSSAAQELDGRAILAETGPELRDSLRSLRKGRHKLTVNVATHARELYDLIEDPGEIRNLAADQPDVVARLMADLEELVGGDLGAESAPPLSDAMRERLEALGYIDPSEG